MSDRERLYLFDTSLRDGGQTEGVNFSLADKQATVKLLEELSIDYIEGGWPGANPVDSQFFAEPRTDKAMFTAFGMTQKIGHSLSNDTALRQVIDSSAQAICLVGKSWDFHVRVALRATLDDNLSAISRSIEAIVAAGKEALFDCEHFFDGYKANPDYALACARAAHEAGARWIVLCDTNGGSMPDEVFTIVKRVREALPEAHLGIHAHDDTGQAVANSLAAVKAGARQIQGTLNGLGERCGNANLISLIPTLVLKSPYRELVTLGQTAEYLGHITSVSRRFDALLNQNPSAHAPYVGQRAFAHKGGLHGSAMARDTSTYEHIDPKLVGNERRMLVSDQAGKANLIASLGELGIDVDSQNSRLDDLLRLVKEREASGYAYEDASGSFELLARRTLDKIPLFYHVEGFRVGVERRFNALGQSTTVTDAIVKITIGGEKIMSVAEGSGPVHALDQALRKDLGCYQHLINDLELIDFKVRILDLNGGTEAVTRVVVESRDGEGRVWRTVGVSPNIVDASFEALQDSIVLKLLRSGAQAPLAGNEKS